MPDAPQAELKAMQGHAVTIRELVPEFSRKLAYGLFLLFVYAVTVLAVPLCLSGYTQQSGRGHNDQGLRSIPRQTIFGRRNEHTACLRRASLLPL